MPRRTYERIADNVLQKLGNRSEVPARLEEWINDGLLWVANHFEHKQLQGLYQETLNAGQYQFSISPVDLWWTVSFQNLVTEDFLEPDAYENVRRRLDSVSATGPKRYALWGDDVFVTPAPLSSDINISIRFLKKPDRWTEGVSVLDEVYDPILELQAAAFGYEHFRLFDLRDHAIDRARQYAIEMRLPVVEEKKDDYKAGFRPPRLRWR